MMCLACEQQGLWLAYLQKRGLITPDGYLTEQPPFLADGGEPQTEPQPAEQAGADETPASAADSNKISGGDPKAG
jgi:hypothetical protein